MIDGCEILYTPFRYAVVPPPMSSSQLTLPSPVGEVTFGPTPRCNDFLALLSDSRVAVFSVEPVGDEEKALRHPAPELVGMSRCLAFILWHNFYKARFVECLKIKCSRFSLIWTPKI